EQRLFADVIGAEPVPDAPERHRVHAFALLPPVDARLAPVIVEPALDELRRLLPARRAAPSQRAEPQPEAVDLQLGPRRAVVLTLERVARIPRAARARHDDARDEVEEAVAALELAVLAHRVRDERAVAQPRVAVLLEVRRGDIAACGRLPGEDHLD